MFLFAFVLTNSYICTQITITTIQDGTEHRKEPEALLFHQFWEKEIPSLKPKTTGNGIRQYTEKDIENLKAVYNLVKVRGFKIAAAKKMLATNKEGVEKSARVIEGLMKVRDELKELKHQLDYLV